MYCTLKIALFDLKIIDAQNDGQNSKDSEPDPEPQFVITPLDPEGN
jgi:hypothetical protein